MYAGGREQPLRCGVRQLRGRSAAVQVCARDQQLRNTGSMRALDHCRAVAVKTCVRQIRTDIDPLHAANVMPAADA